jgi:hypothetical protein
MDISLSSNRFSKGPPGPVGRTVLSLFFLIFLTGGIFFTYFVARDFLRDLRIRNWPSTACTIVGRKVDFSQGGNYKFQVTYRYQFGGETHTSQDFKVSYQGSDQFYDAQKLLDQYSRGMQTTCIVNPADPSMAYLVAPGLAGGFIILLPLLFVAVGAGGIYFIWRPRLSGDRPISDANPFSDVPKPVVLGGFFSIFLAAGLGMLIFWDIPTFGRAWAARSWPQVQCTVISSQVRSHSDQDGTTYSVDVLYQYQFGGHRYRSNRYDLIGGSSSGMAAKQRIASQLPKGTKSVCYVDPLDAAYSTMTRDLGWSTLLALLPLPFILVGVGGLWFVLVPRKNHIEVNANPRRWNTISSVSPRPWPHHTTSGAGSIGNAPVELTPAKSRTGNLIAVILVAAFWNGIVSVFLHQAYIENEGGLFLKLFLIPFILVGVGLIFGIGYTFMQLFNPRIRLTISRREMNPGATAEITWQITGRFEKISHLTITLEGQETASYPNGEDTKTVHHVFSTLPVADFTRAVDIRAGRAQVAIPATAMHTLLLPHNKIEWNFIVKGSIPLWPDVKEICPIAVLPSADFMGPV